MKFEPRHAFGGRPGPASPVQEQDGRIHQFVATGDRSPHDAQPRSVVHILRAWLRWSAYAVVDGFAQYAIATHPGWTSRPEEAQPGGTIIPFPLNPTQPKRGRRYVAAKGRLG